ncbi:MAG: arylsulfatase [Sulfurovum sp.]|nr:MAG: arylsulfatase [Sulfurovum sp.]
MKNEINKRSVGNRVLSLLVLALCGLCLAGSAAYAAKQPNIVVIWGDDTGRSNISKYTHGMMGYRTPNIDSIADDGIFFTDYYTENSCTAGRAAFIQGQAVFRTGNSKVGLPGSHQGIDAKDPTIAELLKPLGYATAQFGKNHLGDRNEYLPTVHGFDEFYGILYHLNALYEPYEPDYPKDPAFFAKYGPRGLMDCKSSEESDPTVDPRFGKVGKQVCKDTGPLTPKHMQTIDDELAERANDYMARQVKADKPFFLWLNFTHMHLWTQTKPESVGQSGPLMSNYADTMIDHDKNVGQVLDKIDELGITDNTIVIYGTDNGPHKNAWPDAGTSPFRSEKDTGWEGAFRSPTMVRWPGHIKPGQVSNDMMSNLDWMPTLLAAAGNPDIKQQLLKGHKAGDMTYNVHLDGYNFLPYLTGKEKKGPRKEFFYFSDGGDLLAMRAGHIKFQFMEQSAPGTYDVWVKEFSNLRIPVIYNLRTDPYEQGSITSNVWWSYQMHKTFYLYPAIEIAGKFLATFKEYPPRHPAASYTMSNAIKAINKLKSGGK